MIEITETGEFHIIKGSPESLKALGEMLIQKAKLGSNLWVSLCGHSDKPIDIRSEEVDAEVAIAVNSWNK